MLGVVGTSKAVGQGRQRLAQAEVAHSKPLRSCGSSPTSPPVVQAAVLPRHVSQRHRRLANQPATARSAATRASLGGPTRHRPLSRPRHAGRVREQAAQGALGGAQPSEPRLQRDAPLLYDKGRKHKSITLGTVLEAWARSYEPGATALRQRPLHSPCPPPVPPPPSPPCAAPHAGSPTWGPGGSTAAPVPPPAPPRPPPPAPASRPGRWDQPPDAPQADPGSAARRRWLRMWRSPRRPRGGWLPPPPPPGPWLRQPRPRDPARMHAAHADRDSREGFAFGLKSLAFSIRTNPCT